MLIWLREIYGLLICFHLCKVWCFSWRTPGSYVVISVSLVFVLLGRSDLVKRFVHVKCVGMHLSFVVLEWMFDWKWGEYDCKMTTHFSATLIIFSSFEILLGALLVRIQVWKYWKMLISNLLDVRILLRKYLDIVIYI